MQKVAIATVGCKVNQYESQVIRERLERRGFRIVPFSSRAEVYIVNTCSVTSRADQKSMHFIRGALRKNSRAKILVTGCLVEAGAEKIKEKIPQVNLVRNNNKLKIETLLTSHSSDNGDFTIHSFFGHDRAFIKVEDGCDQFCSFCRVPYVRGGKIRSRTPRQIIAEIQCLIQAGYQEIVLTGVNLALYGRDLVPPLSLTDLLERVLPFIEGKARIRLSSLEPHLIPDHLLDLMAGSSLICPHLHLPFQSGDDKILARMAREYTSSQMRKLVEKFREKIPQLGISADFIVGFPGEEEENFHNTYKFIEKVKPHRLHIFPFSSRPETPAAGMRPKVPERVKKERSRVLKELSLTLSKDFIEKFTGKMLPVLIESKKDAKTGYLKGYTHNYIKVLIPDKKGKDKKGKIHLIKIIRAEPGYALGELE